MRQKVKEGYSIAIFPEGTRTYDGRMKRFHKGAFYLSEKLQLDIIPVILYGNCKIIAKAQPFNVRKGIMLTEILPRIPANDATYGTTYQERTKSISARMKKEYARICREQSTTDNPVFYENLIQNYIYKGPVEEWYIRIKVKMEDNYRLFNRLVPVKGQITDIGCGFGPLCYMLSQLSEEREITGIDYDEDKIAVAQHGWLRTPRLQFVCANALEYPLPESDVFILNDMLHYMSYELCIRDSLRTGEVKWIPIFYPPISKEEYDNIAGGYGFSYDYNYKESRLVCGFFGYDSLMVTDDLKHIRWYNAKSRYLKSMKPKLGNSMEGINAIIKLNENPRYWHIMYDKYRNVYYRFAEMPYKLASNESPYDEPKGKEFSVIVLNADFEIIGETKFPGKKYFYKKSFVGREGLYISENNLENPQFDENKLVFTCFKIKNASPNK